MSGVALPASLLADGLHRIIKYEGIRGLSKGTIMSIIGVSNGAIQFMAYEELKKVARRRRIKKYGQTDGPVDLVSIDIVLPCLALQCSKS
jgi:solute carrier family 25 folate transporter 32